MNFVEINFIFFLGVVFVIYGLTPSRSWRKLVILLSSYAFYGIWNWKYIPLLIGATLVDFLCAKKIAENKNNKIYFLIISILFNLSLLFVFKYYDFFMAQIFKEHTYLKLVIPVGLSFYTFQSMSYIIDVYRNPSSLEKNISSYLLFTSFFPQLVAGPIERAGHLLPQLNNFEELRFDNIRAGLQLMLLGFFKKIVIADKVAIIVDKYYNHLNYYSGIDTWVAIFCYSIQIYFDFSSYTDIARGVAKIFNITLVENFQLPYFTTSLTEFWKKWHMSLTNWFRDYVFYPIAFNQYFTIHFSIITILVFLMSGLWHGASWNFVVWGGANGLILVLESFYLIYQAKYLKLWPTKYLFIVLNFIVVSMLWILFRSPDLLSSFEVFKGLFKFSNGTNELFTKSDISLVFLIAIAEICTYMHIKKSSFINDFPIYIRWIVYAMLILLIVFVGEYQVRPYIYFQF